MEDIVVKRLAEAEKEHDKHVVLYAQLIEQIDKLKEKKKTITHLLICSKGKIDGYRDILNDLTKTKD